MKESGVQELNLVGMDSARSINMPPKSTKDTSPTPSNSEQLPLLTEEHYPKSTSSLSDFLARICQSLANEQDFLASEAACSLKQLESLTKLSPIILSLKTSKVFYQVTTEKTLTSYCERLPTLGMMDNGNCLILPGFYPRIESGYTLSDILEENPDRKYFLSEKAIVGILRHMEKWPSTTIHKPRHCKPEITKGVETSSLSMERRETAKASESTLQTE